MEFVAYTQRPEIVEFLATVHGKGSPLATASEKFIREHPNRGVALHKVIRLLTYALGRGLEYYDTFALDEIIRRGDAHPATAIRLGRRLMDGLSGLAKQFDIPLRPQGPGLVFHTVLLKTGAAEGLIRDYRDYVQRHDALRFAHLRRCLLEEGARAIERGLWFICLEHTEADIDETLTRAKVAFERHAREWRA
jgi:glutamate-1-semialdehyde aminotransferase